MFQKQLIALALLVFVVQFTKRRPTHWEVLQCLQIGFHGENVCYSEFVFSTKIKGQYSASKIEFHLLSQLVVSYI